MKNITFSINFLNIFLIEILFFKCGRSRERSRDQKFCVILLLYYICYFFSHQSQSSRQQLVYLMNHRLYLLRKVSTLKKDVKL